MIFAMILLSLFLHSHLAGAASPAFSVGFRSAAWPHPTIARSSAIASAIPSSRSSPSEASRMTEIPPEKAGEAAGAASVGVSENIGAPQVDDSSDLQFSPPCEEEEVSWLQILSLPQRRQTKMIYVPLKGGRGFYVDAKAVTNKEYRCFVNAASTKPLSSWPNGEIPEGKENEPAALTIAEARAYARWVGKRLPTVLEKSASPVKNGFHCVSD